MAIYGTLATDNILSINASIADTAVDVFVYDTRKDSDGGAWRKRTQHTSWYNETLNTATRGSRREFPAVAVIVATAAPTRNLYIYDGDDPDLPMWMVVDSDDGQWPQTETASPVYALNGIIVIGSSSDTQPSYATRNRLDLFHFISDKIEGSTNNVNYAGVIQGIVNRSDVAVSPKHIGNSPYSLVNYRINDVAMTVLPNAPIDSATGLPVPTIAVATDGGVSIIKDDGTVVDIAGGGQVGSGVDELSFYNNSQLIVTWDTVGGGTRNTYSYNIPSSDTTANASPIGRYVDSTTAGGTRLYYSRSASRTIKTVGFDDKTGFILVSNGYNPSIVIVDEDQTPGTEGANGMVAYATTSYNTGWMQGRIKGAFLSDTDATNITGSNLIDNGDFGTGDFTNWSVNGTTTPTISNGGALLTTGAIDGAIWQSTSGEATSGKWVITWTVTSNSGGFFGLFLNGDGPNGSGGSLVHDNITASGSYYYEGSITAVEFRHRGSSSGIIDNITLRRVEDDRSVNNKGLQVFGTVTKSPVATGAELVAYSGFSDSTNYLKQPYNSDLDFGTGDFYMSIWAYGGSNEKALMIREEPTTDQNGSYLIFQQSDAYTFYAKTDGSSSWVSFTGTAKFGNYWSQIYLVRSSGVLIGYVNGEQVGSTPFTGNVTNNDAELLIGTRSTSASSSQTFDGKLALAKVGAGAPSPEQIKKMYEDEKVLFQENAACTLYGSSDAVTALAYDDTTSLLYVGTSSGRSEFKGLRRIGNTTTAVTTAISASNGLIAEQ